MHSLLTLSMRGAILFWCCVLLPTHGDEKGLPQRHVRFAFAGDLMSHRQQQIAAYQSGTKTYDFSRAFKHIKPVLEKADFAIANLETTLPGNSRQYRGFPLFGVHDAYAGAVREAGINVLATANNHSLDSFKNGLIRTVKVTRKLGFHQLGTYVSREDFEQNRILMLKKNGLKVAILNYTYGTNGISVPDGVVVNLMTEERVTADLAQARALKPDAIIVVYHWGWEYNRYPNSQQKQFARLSFEHGADVVLGAHPHVVQPYEVRTVTDIYGETRDCLLLYSAGNFFSNQQRRHSIGGIVFHFDLLKTEEGRLVFSKIDHTVTWVYRGYAGGRRFFEVLPVNSALTSRKLPSYERSRMKAHLSSTTALLAAGKKSVKAYHARLDQPLPGPGTLSVQLEEPPGQPKTKKTAKVEVKVNPDARPVIDSAAAKKYRPGGLVVVTAKLIARPTPESVDTSAGNSLGIFEYEVIKVQKGHYPLPIIRVADGLVVGRRLTRTATREIGDVIQIGVVPIEQYPALKRWRLIGLDKKSEVELPLFTPKL